jgi:hypothetical protein
MDPQQRLLLECTEESMAASQRSLQRSVGTGGPLCQASTARLCLDW